MLVLSRKTCQSIIIGGNIEVKLLRVDGNQASIGINAPPNVPVDRENEKDQKTANSPEEN